MTDHDKGDHDPAADAVDIRELSRKIDALGVSYPQLHYGRSGRNWAKRGRSCLTGLSRTRNHMHSQ